VPASELAAAIKKIKELQQLLGKKTSGDMTALWPWTVAKRAGVRMASSFDVTMVNRCV